MKQWLKEFFHNCILHPLLPFLPKDFGNRLHDINGRYTYKDGV